MAGIGALIARRVKRAGDFFVASRALPAGVVFTTLLAANIGAGSTVGATGLGYRFGLSAWWWSGSAALGCLVLGLAVAPRLHRLACTHRFFTVGDFLEWRFDRSVRVLVSGVLWLGTLALLAGQLIAMAWALQVIAGVPRVAGGLLSALVLVAYFGGGGLFSTAWVNVLQLATLLIGFGLALPFAWTAAHGWQGLASSRRPRCRPSAASPGWGPVRHPRVAAGVRAVVHRLSRTGAEDVRRPLAGGCAESGALERAGPRRVRLRARASRDGRHVRRCRRSRTPSSRCRG